MKRIFSVLLVLCMLAAMLPAMTVFASEVVDSGTCGENLTWSLDSDGTLTVSGTGDIKTIPWRTHQSNIKKAVICDGVEWIPNGAFRNCSNLCEVTLPDSLKRIDMYSFSGNKQLKSIHIPKNVENIGYFAFRYNTLNEITVDAENQFFTSINGSLYSRDGSTLLCYSAGKTDKELLLPATVSVINRGAVDNAQYLEEVTLPDNITEIGINSFSNCDSIKTINIGKGLNKIGNLAIYANEKLESIFVDEENGSFSDDNGVLFTKDKSTLMVYPSGKTDVTYQIPNETTKLQAYAFSHNPYLTNLIFGKNIITLGNKFVYSCGNLVGIEAGENTNYSSIDGNLYSYDKSVFYKYATGKKDLTFIMPKDVTELSDAAFCSCKNLRDIQLSKNLKIVGESAFEETDIENISIPSKVTNIANGAFQYCYKLKSTKLPKHVAIDGAAFYECFELKDIYYNGTPTDWENLYINESGNECLFNSNIHYNVCTNTSVTKEGDETIISVIPANAPTGVSILVGLYKNGRFADVAVAEYNGTEITVKTKTDFDEIKVMMWNDLKTMSPICSPEEL